MAINFPSSPTLGQTTTINGVLYTFNGSAWIASVGLPFGETMPTTGQILKYDGAHVVGESEADLLNVNDTPVDGVTSAPISSNWAYDHAALTTAHNISVFGATLVDDVDAATARATLEIQQDILMFQYFSYETM